MVPSDEKWQARCSAQNEQHNTNGGVTKGEANLECSKTAVWPHAGPLVVNCFCNFRHTWRARPKGFVTRAAMFHLRLLYRP